MRFSRFLYTFFILVAAFALVSCSSPLAGPAGQAGLSITIGNQVNSRTLAPNLNMNPDGYTITGTGPAGATFTANSAGGNVTKTGLAFGSWTLVVNAANATGTLIGTGTATAQVNSGATTAVTVNVIPIAGTGTLSLGVNWTAQIQTPSINATLTPALGSAQTLPFTISGATASYSNAAVGNGYYTLGFTLNDGPVSAPIVVAGAVEVVRIVTGQTTSGTYSFANVNAPGGTIDVGINANLQNPLTVSIVGATANLAPGASETLTASVVETGLNAVFVWYVNGVSAGTGSSFNFNAGSVAGYSYRIDVTAFSADGTRAGSGTITVQTAADIPENQGIVTTLAGTTTHGSANGTGTAASFYQPQGIAVDSSGNVYVGDSFNHLVRKITPSGVVTTLAGSGVQGSANGTGTAASFKYPGGIAVDSSGTLFVADTNNHQIRKITPAGVVTTLAGSGLQGSANGTGIAASFYQPTYLALDPSGNLYVSDTSNHLIRKVTPAGVVTTVAGSGVQGSANGTGTSASFYQPKGIAVDFLGNVYVADSSNHLIRKIAPGGVVTTLAGSSSYGSANGVGTAASFYFPQDLAVDFSGNVYVADGSNRMIRKITSTGVVTTLTASLSYPRAIAVDGSRTLYVADGGNHLILKIQ